MSVALLLLLLPAVQDAPVAVRADRIFTTGGQVLEGGVMLLEKGRIKAIGAEVAVPEGVRTIKVGVVMPGLVDAGSGVGVAGTANEDASEVTPDVRFVDSLDPEARDLKRALRAGVTTLHVGPGNRNVIGGVGAVVKTSGATRRSMILREEAALKAALGGSPSSGNYPPRGSAATFFSRRPTTRMGVVWEFRRAFLQAEEGGVIHRARQGNLPVRLSASRATDIESALALSSEFGFTPILEEAQESYRFAAVLAERKIPVLLRPVLSVMSLAGRDGSRSRLNTFSQLRKAGVKTAILAPPGQPGALRTAAAFAVRHGAARADALDAVTRVPAEILGVGDRVGSLKAGMEADFIVLSGDPLDVRSRIEQVFVGGKAVGATAQED